VIFSEIMASDTIFLCRKNGRFFKYDNVSAVSLTGSTTAYAGVTGVDSTDVVTFAGATLSDGLQITFTQLNGGSNVTTNRVYFARDSSGATCKLAETLGGTAVNLGSNITSGYAIIQRDEIRVWSSEFRDIFTNTTTLWPETGASAGAVAPGSFVGAAAVIPSVFKGGGANAITGTGGLAVDGEADLRASVSDEINHQPLRQTFLARTHWIFTIENGTPASLAAEWQTGDVIAPYPPNTV
jgi:hypothetical protein